MCVPAARDSPCRWAQGKDRQSSVSPNARDQIARPEFIDKGSPKRRGAPKIHVSVLEGRAAAAMAAAPVDVAVVAGLIVAPGKGRDGDRVCLGRVERCMETRKALAQCEHRHSASSALERGALLAPGSSLLSPPSLPPWLSLLGPSASPRARAPLPPPPPSLPRARPFVAPGDAFVGDLAGLLLRLSALPPWRRRRRRSALSAFSATSSRAGRPTIRCGPEMRGGAAPGAEEEWEEWEEERRGRCTESEKGDAMRREAGEAGAMRRERRSVRVKGAL